jgi:hypothetical protein
MSISGISSLGSTFADVGLAPSNSTPSSNLFSEFKDLGDALQSGDLAHAQQAYNSLAQNLPGSTIGPFAEMVNKLGQALQSGNLRAGQQVFAHLAPVVQHLLRDVKQQVIGDLKLHVIEAVVSNLSASSAGVSTARTGVAAGSSGCASASGDPGLNLVA